MTGSFEALMASCDMGSLFTATTLFTVTLSITFSSVVVTRIDVLTKVPDNTPASTDALTVMVRLSPAAKVANAHEASSPSVHTPFPQIDAFGSASVV